MLAIVPGLPFETKSVREGCESIILPNYQISIPEGRMSMKTVKVYTPFVAQVNPSWRLAEVNIHFPKFRS